MKNNLTARFALLLSLVGCSATALAEPNPCPIVELQTGQGNISIQLACQQAPLSSADFLHYAKVGLFDGQGFYRVVRADNDHGTPQIDVVQGGLLSQEPAFAAVKHESTAQTGLSHKRGAISLARGEINTGSAAYFFIVAKDSPGLDAGEKRNADQQGFAVFGEVVAGMEIVDAIHQTPASELKGEGYTAGQELKNPVAIIKASIKL
ncbi:peptidylprolyl isomerase [Pseudoalteromonas fenneropenaei]|uniref:peptidylprolyl isomerase n=1 Tax=Pseudoalteromonas fenneropenaei TaxID=1737459 RepID=A0ABV7CJD6_9GAMM